MRWQGLGDLARSPKPTTAYYQSKEYGLKFTEHLKRISELADQMLVEADEVNLTEAKAHLDSIQAHAATAQEILDKVQWIRSQGGISSEGFGR